MRKLGFLFLFIHLIVSKQLATAQTNYLTSFDGVKIAYSIEGKGAPILLIHGFIQNGKSWHKTELKKALLANGYQVIIPDLRGNGDSDKPQKDESYADDVEVKDLILLMDNLKIRKYSAVGYSRGSIVLAKLLIQDNRITKAVLGGMGIDFTDPNWDRKHMFAAAFAGKVNELTEGAVAYATSINADFRSLHLQQKFQPVTTVSELAELKLNVLVIAGDEDLENGDPEELQKAIPGAVLKLVLGNHNETYKTVAFSKEVADFIED
ncbi:alpha/beta fold hydrolase [Croceitalea rosinachiae]|uniref:Alpha/beta fold hydrolase n=1 Tax=Croceitalea rosinachiae TaxID=3075596 RepID=A0ABU3AAM2_9FLAO|nr:alpha/beta fold hydrolase [Croceitalea sp. F388]MDT0607219.1 alpha/beta fold hydrolase [Croceitalea sp. F388]